MILNLKFLSEVYGSNKLSVKKTLSSASDLQIKILINVLHYVAAGDIKLTRNDFDTTFSRILKKKAKPINY